jgi:hypothetical protein
MNNHQTGLLISKNIHFCKSPAMKQPLLICAMALTLFGCASTGEVVSVGKDTYMVSGWGKSPGGYSGSEVKAAAIKKANEFCVAQGRRAQVVSAGQRDMSFGVNANAEIQFMCLETTDEDFTRSTVRRESDSALEIRKDLTVTDSKSTTTTYDELIKLDELRKRGIITEAEFAAQKAKLLRN